MPEAKLLNKQFEFVMPLQKSQSGMQSDGFYHIEFAISNTDPDLQGDQMTEKCIDSMAMQAKGLNVDGSDVKKSLIAKGINIDDNHFEGLKAIIGPVTDAWVDAEKVLWVDLRVNEEWESTIKSLINSESPIGGSIQGHATEILEDDGSGIQKIDGVFLVKAALTDTPANWTTRGTARASTKTEKTCYGSMCRQIYKSLDIDVEKIKKSDWIVNQTCLDFAKEQIDNDNINNGSWNKPLFADFDNKIDEYKKYALAVHPDMDEKLAGSYGFEIGKNSKIYRQGVIAAKTAAAGGMSSAGKNTELYDAADELLKLIDEKSAVNKSIGGDKIKKTVLSVNDAFETIQAEINGELDKKYGTPNQWGGFNRDCYLQYTSPDSIFVSSDWDISSSDDLYTIPYTREDDGTGNMKVKLGDPVRADLQFVTKALQESKWMIKAVKPNGGGKLTKTENIPEGMDETFVDKVKGLGDEGKEFIKGVLGIEKNEPEPTITEPEPSEPTVGVQKGMISKLDVTKMLDERDSKFEKTLKEKDEKIKSLETRLDSSDETDLKKTKKNLLTKSLDLHKKLEPDMTPEQESDLVKEIKADLEKDIGPELVKRDIKTMTKSLEGRPAHELPFTGGHKQKGLGDKYNDEIKEVQKSLDEQGKVGV
ncbi:hypothetical protein [Methanobacterium spitsbergense]|uniref:Uncharacterized protein n=1 Tax=Methanobacterium spitsbergense TaxID=2874285 RepID=A0A8T5UWN4_9EURY|nr:hypothetical protein [Methanobacterium spitsbergense]MBZ2166306.1 hypothetical protein [Methanobacterium spitsbergense]